MSSTNQLMSKYKKPMQWQTMNRNIKKPTKFKMNGYSINFLMTIVILASLPYSSTLNLPSGDPAPGRSPGPPIVDGETTDDKVIPLYDETTTTEEVVEVTTVSEVGVSERTVDISDACAFARIPSDSDEVVTVSDEDSDVNLTLSHPVFETDELVRGVVYDDGGSFLGVLFEVNIKGQTDRGETETNLFFKIRTPGEQATFISMPIVYRRELYIYTELSKIYNELQHEANIPHEERYKFVKSYDESVPDVIILQNMRKMGYKAGFRRDMPTLQFLELVVKNMAKFHALSLALEAKRPDYFEKNIKSLIQPFSFDDDWICFAQNSGQIALSYLDGERRSKLEHFLPHLGDKYAHYFHTMTDKGALCHGDYKLPNILMKEENGNIRDMIIIDYQLVHYGCPVMDFFYLIYQSTDRELRKAHLNHLKETYYDTIKTFLRRFDLDAVNIYPKHEFEAQYNERLGYGLLSAIVLLPFILAVDKNIDIVAEPLAGLNVHLDDQYRDRIAGVVDDYVEFGLL